MIAITDRLCAILMITKHSDAKLPSSFPFVENYALVLLLRTRERLICLFLQSLVGYDSNGSYIGEAHSTVAELKH